MPGEKEDTEEEEGAEPGRNGNLCALLRLGDLGPAENPAPLTAKL